MSNPVQPFALKHAPALIERLLPVQKLSSEAYKEQMSNQGKTLTALGSYWKGRKPLILNKACILGCLLPATNNPKRDLEIFEKLMAMDDESFVARWPRRPRPREVLATLSIADIAQYFVSDPPMLLPQSAPVDWSKPELTDVKVRWRDEFLEAYEWNQIHKQENPSFFSPDSASLLVRRQLEAQMLPKAPYLERVEKAKRPEEVMDTVHVHIWDAVNDHLGTNARSFPELVEQLGILRFGHRPGIADTFCGSGQIPFEAARLGCDVYASDLNPIASMLTWGAFHIIGSSRDSRVELECNQQRLMETVRAEIDELGVETDGNGWRAKAFLYCLETRCPQTGWLVPLIPSLIISRGKNTIAELIPDEEHKRYSIVLRSGVTEAQVAAAAQGTIGRDAKFSDAYLIHKVGGVSYKTRISTLRGEYEKSDGTTGSRIRPWAKGDFKPSPEDIFQERAYAQDKRQVISL